MSKVFIHVGLHKTATTFLQQEVFPKLSQTTSITQKYILQNHAFNKLMYADKSLYDVEEVLEEIQNIGNSRLILSEENFSGTRNVNFLNRSIIAERLSNLFPEAEIILFLRGQESMLSSLYNQAIKIGKTGLPVNKFIWRSQHEVTYREYLNNKNISWNKKRMYYHVSDSIHPEHYCYLELVDMYHNLFPKVHVFLYEEFKENPRSVINRLLEIFDDNLLGFDYSVLKKNVNSRLSSDSLKRRRFENQIKLANLTKSKYVIKILAAALELFQIKNNDDNYLNELIGSFYAENNNELIHKYPHIPLRRYSEAYQLP